MEDHETRRKIIREWKALPKEQRQTEEQVAAFAKKAAQQNEFHRSRRDPSQKFRRDPYQKLMGWILPRAGKSDQAVQLVDSLQAHERLKSTVHRAERRSTRKCGLPSGRCNQ